MKRLIFTSLPPLTFLQPYYETVKNDSQMLKTELFTPSYQNFDIFIQRSEATMTTYARRV